jgi:hypothetical protein
MPVWGLSCPAPLTRVSARLAPSEPATTRRRQPHRNTPPPADEERAGRSRLNVTTFTLRIAVLEETDEDTSPDA